MSASQVRLDGGLIDDKIDASVSPVDAGVTGTFSGPVVYRTDRIHSVLTSSMVNQWQEILSRNSMSSDQSFIKVGDSITVSNQFLKCFDGDNVDLDQFSSLAETVVHFRSDTQNRESPFYRDSEAAEVGRTAEWVLSGDPSPLEGEMTAMNPSYGVVMFGTNDVGILSRVDFSDAMMQVVEKMMSQGVLPILNTVPPRPSSESANQNVTLFNEIIRGIAQARQIPLIDFHLSLAELPEYGLAGDAIHPSAYRTNEGIRACVFSQNGLQHGYNQRNFRTLEALHRLRSTVFLGETEYLESDAPTVEGVGTSTSPIVISGLPFSNLKNTSESSSQMIDEYPGCSAPQDESGKEYFYKFELSEPTRIKAMVFDQGDVDIDVHLLKTSIDGNNCIARAHNDFDYDLEAGTYYFVLDSYVPQSGVALEGEYLFIVTEVP